MPITRLMQNADKFRNASLALQKLAGTLQSLPVPFAVIGGMALHAYGYERLTTDADILLTSEGYQKVILALVGNGYREDKLPGRIIDEEFATPIDLCVSDGTVRWPSLFRNTRSVDGIPVIKLAKLIDMKLSSGRIEDLQDVRKLQVIRKLEKQFARGLAAENRDKWNSLFDGTAE